jgi:hypothetical protein
MSENAQLYTSRALAPVTNLSPLEEEIKAIATPIEREGELG